MSKTFTFSLAAAALVTGAIAHAQADERPARGAAMTQQQATAMAERAFARLDANSDGTIDEADRAAHQRARFDKLDADGNGAISFAEFEAARENRRENRREARGERGRRGGGGLAGLHRLGRMVRGADADANGAISREEFHSAALARFERLDANDDGTVSPEERAARRGHGRGPGHGSGHGPEKRDGRGPAG